MAKKVAKKVKPVEPDLTNTGAGILGMYAAIRICLHNGIDPHEFCDMILREVWPERTDLLRGSSIGRVADC